MNLGILKLRYISSVFIIIIVYKSTQTVSALINNNFTFFMVVCPKLVPALIQYSVTAAAKHILSMVKRHYPLQSAASTSSEVHVNQCKL